MTKRLIAISGMLLAGTATLAQAPAPDAPMPPAHAMAPMPPRMAMRTPMPKTRAEIVAAARAEFARFDKNKDGFITRDELPAAPPMRRMAMRPPMPPIAHADGGKAGADALFAMMDTDKDGQISKAEFEAFHAGRMRHTVEVTRDKEGHERRSERMTVMRGDAPPPRPGMMPPMGMEGRGGMMLAWRFDRLDTNHDGKLSAQEVEAGALARFDRMGRMAPPPSEAGRPGPGYDLPATPPAPMVPPAKM